MDKKAEAYTILMEECGELIQACSKMIRTKGSAVYRKQLQDEIGDVVTLIEWLLDNGVVTEKQIEDRVKIKEEKLRKWSSLYG